MEDIDFSNYFYLIFLAISLIVGALGKKKKGREKVKTPQQSTSQKNEPGLLETMLEEMGMTEEQTKSSPKESEPVKNEHPQKDEVTKLAERLRQKSAKDREIRTSFEDGLSGDDQSAYSLKKTGSSKSAKGRVDLRQAVIHDAILNRPKY